MATSFVVVYGAPTSGGRLARAAATAARCASDVAGSPELVSQIDLSATSGAGPLGDGARAMVRAVDQASAVIILSPVYRASFPGILKCLLDELPVDALKFKPVGIIAMGGTLHHYLAVDRHLRDVLAWYGALVAPTSIYATGKSFDDGEPSAELAAEIDALIGGVASLIGHRYRGPDPLAASVW